MSETRRAVGATRVQHDSGLQRIEFDRRRMILTTVMSALAVVASWTAVAYALAHVAINWARPTGVPQVDRIFSRIAMVPWWFGLALLPAAALATARFVRNVYRLQDAEPAFVISPQGLQFRPSVLDDRVRVPWAAIRGITPRRVKNYRAIALQIDDIDRHVPRSGPLAGLRRIAHLGRNTIVIGTPLSRHAWKELVALLQQRLAEYGRGDAPAADRVAATGRDGAVSKGHA